MSETIRVATFNLKHGATENGYIGKPRQVTRACAQLDADILALQEVDRRIWRSWFTDLAERAKGEAYDDVVFGLAMQSHPLAGINPGGEYGNALLVKGSLQDEEIIPLSGDYKRLKFRRYRYNFVREPRSAIIATAIVKGGEIAVAATHLGGNQFVRKKQFDTVMDALQERPRPWILMGDLNTRRREVVKWLQPYGMELAYDAFTATCSVSEPTRHIDHIAVGGLAIDDVDTQAFAISDHRALMVEASL